MRALIPTLTQSCCRYLLLCGIAVFAACTGGTDQNRPHTRSFAMGFTPWPYAATPEAVNFVYAEIANRGDIIAHHLDGGIPWQEALNSAPYPPAVENELKLRLANTPSSKRVYLALNPLNAGRNGLADYWGDSTGQALPAEWATRDFDSPEVILAFTHFAKDLITRFKPEYFNLGIEASELALNNPSRYDKFVVFIQQVSSALHTDFPQLKLMISVAIKSPNSNLSTTINTQIPRLVPYIDVLGASAYPYVFFDHTNKGNPANLPSNWLSQIKLLANGKPIAVTETGWSAETLDIPSYGIHESVTPQDQEAYLDVLFRQAQTLNAEFVIWFSLVDFDTLWNSTLNQDPLAQIWRDTGLFDQDLKPRPAFSRWKQELDLSFKAATP